MAVQQHDPHIHEHAFLLRSMYFGAFRLESQEIFFPSKPLGLDFSKSIPMTVKGVKKDLSALAASNCLAQAWLQWFRRTAGLTRGPGEDPAEVGCDARPGTAFTRRVACL